MPKPTLDKDLKKVSRLEHATQDLSRSVAAPGLTLLFIAAVIVLSSIYIAPGPLAYLVVAASVVGAYMAMNIGANDVANNMGPAVGSRAVTLAGAIVIAAICEAAGAMLAGGDVVTTISKNIIRGDMDLTPLEFILLMMSALLAAAMWIHLATILGAPVSTTHSVVGGVLGAGISAAGFAVVYWPTMAAIAASWVISPLMGGVIAAALLGFVKWAILFRPDRIAAARYWVPVLIGLMTGIFAVYLANKGLSRVWSPSAPTLVLLGGIFFATGIAVSRPWIVTRSNNLENRRKHVSSLFNIPLVIAAGLLSFAHGANDVANAVGPLAAIVMAAQAGAVAPDDVMLPFWVLIIGGVGIAIGLALFGPRLIRTVGEKITKMDAIRAYCVALAAAITVLVASALGMPISSTHTAIGAIFGVGFLREAITNKGVPNVAVQPRSFFLEPDVLNKTPEDAVRNHRKRLRRQLVRRRHVLGIVAAWLVTVPAAGLLAAGLFRVMRTMAGL